MSALLREMSGHKPQAELDPARSADLRSGRRWRFFIGQPHAGWRSAGMYSILGSCRRQGLNLHKYLADVLGR
jgi:hypothetical protein